MRDTQRYPFGVGRRKITRLRTPVQTNLTDSRKEEGTLFDLGVDVNLIGGKKVALQSARTDMVVVALMIRYAVLVSLYVQGTLVGEDDSRPRGAHNLNTQGPTSLDAMSEIVEVVIGAHLVLLSLRHTQSQAGPLFRSPEVTSALARYRLPGKRDRCYMLRMCLRGGGEPPRVQVLPASAQYSRALCMPPSDPPHQQINKSADRAEIGTIGTDRHRKQRRHGVRSA